MLSICELLCAEDKNAEDKMRVAMHVEIKRGDVKINFTDPGPLLAGPDRGWSHETLRIKVNNTSFISSIGESPNKEGR